VLDYVTTGISSNGEGLELDKGKDFHFSYVPPLFILDEILLSCIDFECIHRIAS
jgi:hypothetical protein